jgi:hypothetical protein
LSVKKRKFLIGLYQAVEPSDETARKGNKKAELLIISITTFAKINTNLNNVK